jgi:DNA-binding NarL/FixJ family response regulator
MADAAARLAELGPLLAGALAPRVDGGPPARVLVLHADALVGRGLARLAERGDAASATVAPSVAAAVAAGAAAPPDVVVCDLWTAGMRVDAVARSLREAGVRAPLVVVASADAPEGLRASRLAGAAAYLARRDAVSRLGAALASVRGGTAALPAADAPDGAAPELTPREGELLEALDQGLRFKQVAARLGISEATAKTHGRNLFRKLGATSRAEAVHAARERGLLA